jgi:benzoylformate decarboxylase
VALGSPDSRVIALIGDGSSMYGIQALWSAVQLKLPMTFVIINNGCYLALKHMAEMFQMKDPVGIELPGIDFVGLATALGCEASRVERHEDLDGALKQALGSKGPCLLEVMVEPTF